MPKQIDDISLGIISASELHIIADAVGGGNTILFLYLHVSLKMVLEDARCEKRNELF